MTRNAAIIAVIAVLLAVALAVAFGGDAQALGGWCRRCA